MQREAAGRYIIRAYRLHGTLENKSHELSLMAGQCAVAGVKHSSGFSKDNGQ